MFVVIKKYKTHLFENLNIYLQTLLFFLKILFIKKNNNIGYSSATLALESPYFSRIQDY